MSLVDTTQIHVIAKVDNILKRTHDSSTNFIRRFFGDTRPTIKASLAKLNEELDEFKQAIWELESGETVNTDHLVNEAADVLVTHLNTLYAVIGDDYYAQLEAALNRTIEKNDAKTHETHEVVNGLIARKKAST